MSETRTPLGSLASTVNVEGEDSLRRRVGPELTPLDRHARRMHEQQQQVGGTDPGARGRLSAYVFDVFRGDGEWSPTQPYHLQDVKESSREADHPMDFPPSCITRDDRQWPISLEQFKELNVYLAANSPTSMRTTSGSL